MAQELSDSLNTPCLFIDAGGSGPYRALLTRIGPAIIVAHSSGGYLATLLAAELPQLVPGVVTIELTAVPSAPSAGAQRRATCPQLIV